MVSEKLWYPYDKDPPKKLPSEQKGKQLVWVLRRKIWSGPILVNRKQEFYFVKPNYEIFSIVISAREKLRQNMLGYTKGWLGQLVGESFSVAVGVGVTFL